MLVSNKGLALHFPRQRIQSTFSIANSLCNSDIENALYRAGVDFGRGEIASNRSTTETFAHMVQSRIQFLPSSTAT